MTRPYRRFYLSLAVAALTCFAAAQAPQAPAEPAPDLVGVWRGQVSFDNQALSIVIHIGKDDAGKLTVYAENPMDSSQVPGSISFQDSKLHIDFDQGSYDGTLSSDGDTVDGSLNIGGAPQKCPLQRDKS